MFLVTDIRLTDIGSRLGKFLRLTDDFSESSFPEREQIKRSTTTRWGGGMT